MEFLEPEQKRARTLKLFVGYVLITVAIALATLILVYLAQGYGYSGKAGVTQNGLVFIESKPVSAKINIDNQDKGNTDARIVLSEGKHDILLKADKYRQWSKSFVLEGGSVQYFLYPRLFPVDITVNTNKLFLTPPIWASQSLDRHWLVVQQTSDSPTVSVIDLLKPNTEPLEANLDSTNLLYEQGSYGKLTPVEWSDDNKHLLLLQTMPSGALNYIMFNREVPAESISVSKQISLSAGRFIKLKDKKYDKYYVHDKTTGALFAADLKSGIGATPVLTGVIDYKSYGNDIILYATYIDVEAANAKIMILNGTNKYILSSVIRNPENIYLLDVAKFDGVWEYVAASPVGNKVHIYRNPLSKAKANDPTVIFPNLSFGIDNPQYVSFSDNARFIAVQSGKKFIIYDGEQKRVYRYESSLNLQPKQQAKWMDGHRLTAVTDSKINVWEFDGTNQQTLISSRPEFTAYFDRDYKYMYSLAAQTDGKTALQNGLLILP